MMRWAVHAARLWKIRNAIPGPQTVYPKVFSISFTLQKSRVAQSLIDWLRTGPPEFDSCQCQGIFSPPQHSDRIWALPQPLPKGYWWLLSDHGGKLTVHHHLGPKLRMI
jgi:hypothetical protein